MNLSETLQQIDHTLTQHAILQHLGLYGPAGRDEMVRCAKRSKEMIQKNIDLLMAENQIRIYHSGKRFPVYALQEDAPMLDRTRLLRDLDTCGMPAYRAAILALEAEIDRLNDQLRDLRRRIDQHVCATHTAYTQAPEWQVIRECSKQGGCDCPDTEG